MESDLARSHHPDTNVGKKASFITTVIKGAARNYGESADERKGKRVHFRNRNGVLYEFRHTKGFIQYACVDCEKLKKYTMIYVDQDGCYTKEPEEVIHLCNGHKESNLAPPGHGVAPGVVQQGSSTTAGPCAEHATSQMFANVTWQPTSSHQQVDASSTVPASVAAWNQGVEPSAAHPIQALQPVGQQSALGQSVQCGSIGASEPSHSGAPIPRFTALVGTSYSSASVNQGPPVSQGTAATSLHNISLTSKEATIQRLEQLLQEQPEGAQLTLSVSILQTVLAGTFYFKLYSDVDPASTADIDCDVLRAFLKCAKSSVTTEACATAASTLPADLSISGGPTLSGNCATTTSNWRPAASASLVVPLPTDASLLPASNTFDNARRIIPESTNAPSTSQQANLASMLIARPQSRATGTNPLIIRRTPFKKVLAGKGKSERRKQPAAKESSSKVNEKSRLWAELAQLKRNQKEMQSQLQALLTSQQNSTGGYVNTHVSLPLAPPHQFLSRSPTGSTAAADQQHASAFFRGPPLQSDSYFGCGGDGDVFEAGDQRHAISCNEMQSFDHAIPPCYSTTAACARYGYPLDHQCVDPGNQVSAAIGQQLSQLETPPVQMPETFSNSYLPQEVLYDSNNPTDAPANNETTVNDPRAYILEALDLETWDEFFVRNTEQSDPLRRSAARAALLPGKLMRAQIRFPLPNRLPTRRRRASESDKKPFNTNNSILSNGNKAPEERAKKGLVDPDTGTKRGVNGQPTARTKATINVKDVTSKQTSTPAPSAYRPSQDPLEEFNPVDSPQDEYRPADLGNVLPNSPSAGDLPSLLSTKMRFTAGEPDEDTQDNTQLRVRLDSASSTISAHSTLFLSSLATPVGSSSSMPSADATGLPESNGTDKPGDDQMQPYAKEYSVSYNADEVAHGIKRQTMTDSSLSPDRGEVGPASSRPSFGGPCPSPNSKETKALIRKPPRGELRPETVVKLLEATVKTIICSDAIMYSPRRPVLDRTIQAWHRLRIVDRTIYDDGLQETHPQYAQKELDFISSYLTELVPSAAHAHSKADLVCYSALLNYIYAVVYSWYISYDFDAIPWIRKLFCTAAQFRESLNEEEHGVEISRSLIFPRLASEAHLFRQLFNYALPADSIRRIKLEGSDEDTQQNTSHFENMRKLYDILWNDKMLSQETFPAFHRFIKQCLDQDLRCDSKLLARMVLRRAISAIVQPESKEGKVRIRNLLVLHRIMIDNDCDQLDVSGYDLADYARKFGNTSVLELRRNSTEQGPQQDRRDFSREDKLLASGRVNEQSRYDYAGFQYGDHVTGVLWDSVEPELQRPFELSVTRLFLDPGFVEFSDWRFEPQLIRRVLRSDISYLGYIESNAARFTRDDRPKTKTHAKPFHLVLDLGTLADNQDEFWHYGSGLMAKFNSGRLGFYFMENEFNTNVEDLFLVDYTISFGSVDRPGPTLRFLRIVEMGEPLSSEQLVKLQESSETQSLVAGGILLPSTQYVRPAIPQLRVLGIDKRVKFRPYLEVRGTAIPIYSSLTDLNKLLNGVHGHLAAMEKLDHALDVMTANGWSNHIQGIKNASDEQGSF